MQTVAKCDGHFNRFSLATKKVLAPRSVLTLFLTLINHRRHHRLLHPNHHEHRYPAELEVRE